MGNVLQEQSSGPSQVVTMSVPIIPGIARTQEMSAKKGSRTQTIKLSQDKTTIRGGSGQVRWDPLG